MWELCYLFEKTFLVILQEISGRTNGTTATLDDSNQSFDDESEMSPERLQIRLKQLEDILSGV
jgi:hypothetical protein